MNREELLKILACPACHGKLSLEKSEDKGEGFVCARCRLFYPVVNDIPVMLVERASPLDNSGRNVD